MSADIKDKYSMLSWLDSQILNTSNNMHNSDSLDMTIYWKGQRDAFVQLKTFIQQMEVNGRPHVGRI
jgi:hypothetical protein